MTGKEALEDLAQTIGKEEWFYSPIPLDANGEGPCKEDDCVHTSHEVWDAAFCTVAIRHTKKQAEDFSKLPDRIRAIATDFAALEARVQVLSAALEQLHGPLSVAALEARAIAAEERVKRLEAALTPYVKATKYNGAGAFAMNTAMLSDTDHRTAHRIIVTEPALERAAFAEDEQ